MTGRSSNFETVDFTHQLLSNQHLSQNNQKAQQNYHSIPQSYRQIQVSSHPQSATDLDERSGYAVKNFEATVPSIDSTNQGLPNHIAFLNHQKFSTSFPKKPNIDTIDLTVESSHKANLPESFVKIAKTTGQNPSNLPVSQNYRNFPITSSPKVAAGFPDQPNHAKKGSGHITKKPRLMQRPETVAIKGPNDLQESLSTDGASSASILNQAKSPTSKEYSPHAGDANSLPSGKKPSTSNAHSIPIFPTRPYIHRPNISKRAGTLAIERAAVKHVVQVEPYRPEPPPSVPRYRGGRSFLTYILTLWAS